MKNEGNELIEWFCDFFCFRQPSPSSGTTGTSTISSSGPDGENEQNIGMYAVEGASTETSTVTPVDSSPSLPQNTISSSGTVTSTGTTPNITRSMSAPSGQRPLPPVTSTNSATMGQRSRLRRNPSRTDAIRKYVYHYSFNSLSSFF